MSAASCRTESLRGEEEIEISWLGFSAPLGLGIERPLSTVGGFATRSLRLLPIIKPVAKVPARRPTPSTTPNAIPAFDPGLRDVPFEVSEAAVGVLMGLVAEKEGGAPALPIAFADTVFDGREDIIDESSVIEAETGGESSGVVADQIWGLLFAAASMMVKSALALVAVESKKYGKLVPFAVASPSSK